MAQKCDDGTVQYWDKYTRSIQTGTCPYCNGAGCKSIVDERIREGWNKFLQHLIVWTVVITLLVAGYLKHG